MQFTLNGENYELDRETVIGRLRGRPAEPIQKLWVAVAGQRYPVKQALEIVLTLHRTTFTSHQARSVFARLGFETNGKDSTTRPTDGHGLSRRVRPLPGVSPEEAAAAFGVLVAFLREQPFTSRIAQLEHDLVSAGAGSAPAIAERSGLDADLLTAALIVRRDVGRVSDVIHAAAISLALPLILESGEVVTNRPSLGPGNDKTRPFDLETDRRVAEFKVAMWSGGDVMRKRGVTADLVHLAMDDSGRRAELWVAGEESIHFLRTATSSVQSMLSRSSDHLRERFVARYGEQDIALNEFMRVHANQVQLRNLADVLPAIAAAL